MGKTDEGKAEMLCAYYDCFCDFHALFDDKEIARRPGYQEHMNQYQVINIDLTSFLSLAQRKGIPLRLKRIADVVYLPKQVGAGCWIEME